MEERIRKFMEYKGISPSELADSIGVQRSNVTHVLKGRNKPSFQFIEKMLQIYPELNAKWLLLGSGPMVDQPAKTRTLFDQSPELPAPSKTNVENKVESPPKSESKPAELLNQLIDQPMLGHQKQEVKNDIQDQFFTDEKPIERLIVFYKDSTFKVYNPSR